MRRRIALIGSLAFGLLLAVSVGLTAQAQESPLALGVIPTEGLGLVAWDGTLDDLAGVAAADGCRLESVWATVDGQFVGYTVGAPAFVNAGFAERIGTTLRSDRVVLLVCAEGGTSDPPRTTPAPASTPAPTPTATRVPGAQPAPPFSTTPLYDPFGPDLSCGDFPTQADAQILFEAAGGPGVDRHGLDADGNGIACEELP